MKSALITGGAKRIGRAIVEDLAANGFDVAIHANRSVTAAKELAEEVSTRGGKAVVVRADLTRLDETSGLVSAANEAIGPLTLLVNGASQFMEDKADKFDSAAWDAHFALHARAPVVLTQAFAAQRPPECEGLVVNIIDQRVWRLTPKFMSYTLSKSTLWTATRTLAQGLAPHVRVNAIGPGPTLASDRQSADDFEAQTRKTPLGHGPELVEFGRTIRYLFETTSITGQMIALDGGQHLAWRTPDNTDIEE